MVRPSAVANADALVSAVFQSRANCSGVIVEVWLPVIRQLLDAFRFKVACNAGS